MAIRKRKPTSPGRRFQTVSDFAEITRDRPERSLTKPKPKTGGRNSYGRMTSRHRGGGHKQKYRVVDFKRDKDGVPAKVASIEYDPNRNARIALLHYLDGEKRYILAPSQLAVGDMLQSGHGSEIRPGNALPLRYIPVGTVVHNVELKPGAGGKMGRGAGASIQLVAKEGQFATLRLPSTEMLFVWSKPWSNNMMRTPARSMSPLNAPLAKRTSFESTRAGITKITFTPRRAAAISARLSGSLGTK